MKHMTAYGRRLVVDPQITLDDICCGAGLAADGYGMAGVRVRRGIDLVEQPLYPHPIQQRDALEYLESDDPEDVDALHTSFPCQGRTRAGALRIAQGGTVKWPDILDDGVHLLRTRWAHKPWIVENVDSRSVVESLAPRPGEYLVRLCGSMFGLEVQRHRWFLSNFPLRQPACDHSRFPLDPITRKPRPWGVYHVKGDSVPSGGRTALSVEHGRRVMGVSREVPWDELKEGIPPHYTAHIGADLVRHLLAGDAVHGRLEVPA